jgi:hypothetical protein
MTFKNNITTLLLKQNIPIFELMLKDISVNYGIDYQELEQKYIKTLPVIKKKRNINKKGQMTSYSFFLKDNEVSDKLKEQYPEKTFGEISKLKGNIWRSMSKVDKSKYVKMADAAKIKLKTEKIQKHIDDVVVDAEEVDEEVEEENTTIEV